MRNIIGQAVSGDDFFERPQVIRKIRRKLQEGSHIYLSAPRRVGKTSIMHYLKDNPWDNYHFLYVITQSRYDADDFYKELCKVVIDSELFRGMRRVSDKLKNALQKVLHHISLEIDVPFVKLSTQNTETIDFQLEFERLLEELDLSDKKLVIMVDEFTQTVENMMDIDKGKARHFLQTFRELTHNQKLSGKVQFLLTGSIGLQPLVKKLESTDLINHLTVIDVPPLSQEEAIQLFQQIIAHPLYKVDIHPDVIFYILQKLDVHWLIPFHVQLAIQEIIDVYESENKPITKELADKAFQQILHQRNNSYFSQYYERLKKRLDTPDYKFAYEVLQTIAQKDVIDKMVVYDLAVKHQVTNTYKAVVESLLYDGYIHNPQDSTQYRFTSSILKLWWKKYVC